MILSRPRAAHREDQAAECYKKSLEQNAFMWSSFVHLSNMGATTPARLCHVQSGWGVGVWM